MADQQLPDAYDQALVHIAQGSVRRRHPARGVPFYAVTGQWQKPDQSVYQWLIENHFASLEDEPEVTLGGRGIDYIRTYHPEALASTNQKDN